MSSSGSFPLLTTQDILLFSREWAVQVSEEDINHPTPTKVLAILEYWMAITLSLNCEDIRTATECRLDQIEPFNDVYREALFMNLFVKSINQILERAAIEDFTLTDLTLAMSSSRLRTILSGLINFRLFEQEQAAEYLSPVQLEADEFETRENMLMSENERLASEMARLSEQRLADEPKIDEYQSKIMQTKEEMRQMKSKANELQVRLDAAKAEAKQINDSNNEITLSNRSLETELSRLKFRLLKSPERMRADVSRLKVSLDKEKENVAALEKKESELMGKLSSLRKYQSDLSQCIKIMDEWQIDVDKLSESTKRYESHTELLETLLAEASDYENNIANLNRRITMVKDELARNQDKTEKKRIGSKQRIRTLTESQVALNEQRRALELQAESKMRDVNEIEREIMAIHQDAHSELEKHRNGLNGIKDQLVIYSIKVNKAFDSLNMVNAEPVELLT